MSDRVAKSYSGYDRKAGQSIHPYQSAWTAHWAGTRCDTSPQIRTHSSCPRGKIGESHDNKPHQFLSGVEIASEIPKSAKGFGDLEHCNAEVINKGLAASSKNLTNESLCCQLYPTVELCQGSGGNFSLQKEKDISGIQELRPQVSCGKLPTTLNIFPVSPPAAETPTRESQFQPEGILQFPAEQAKYHMFFGESNYSSSRALKGKSTVPASQIVPTRLDHDEFSFDSGRTALPSFMRRQEEIKQVTSILASKQQVSKTNLTIMGQEHSNYQSHSALLVCEERMSNFPKCENSATPYLRENNTGPLEIGPSTSTCNSRACDDGQYQRLRNQYGSGFFPSLSSPSELTKSGKLQYGQCSRRSIPHFVHDVLDSAEGLAGGQSRFSQTTHSLVLMEHTDFSLCKEKQILGESRGSFSELHRTFPLCNHGKQGVKLQLLGSSTESEEKEEKEDAGVVKTSGTVQKNESSAETDIMDMEPFKEKDHLSGANPSPSSKDLMTDRNLAPQIASTTAAGSRKRTIELLDINLELPAAPASSSSIEKSEPSTSKTQSLDMELLLADADKPGYSKSINCQDAPLEPELSSSWVKRLKLTVPNSAALGTNSNLEESSSHEKVNKFFSKFISTTNDSEPTTSHRPGKELMALDQTSSLLRTGESSSTGKGVKDQDITLSHSWIQRWRHSQAKKKSETLVTSDPESPKLGSEDFEKKFPSIAAMALMGKVMTGVQTCKFHKKGPFIVWNTKGL